MDRMKRLREVMRNLMEGGFSGYIKINFTQGSLGRVEKYEELEEPETLPTGEKTRENHDNRIGNLVCIILLLFQVMPNCAFSDEQHNYFEKVHDVRVVQPGDSVAIGYLCKLTNGQIVAASDFIQKDQRVSTVFLSKDKEGPVSMTAGAPLPVLPAGREMAFEDEITYRLADLVVGMKEGQRRQVELTAPDISARSQQNYVTQLSRIRKRPKEMKIPLGDYQARTNRSPEVGQPFAYDPAFPGRVEAVTDKDVLIRFSKPSDVIETPLGPGHVRETEKNYEVNIDARKGDLIRVGNIVGCIAAVDDQIITLDFRNPFGGQTLICDMAIEKVYDAKPVTKGVGE